MVAHQQAIPDGAFGVGLGQKALELGQLWQQLTQVSPVLLGLFEGIAQVGQPPPLPSNLGQGCLQPVVPLLQGRGQIAAHTPSPDQKPHHQ